MWLHMAITREEPSGWNTIAYSVACLILIEVGYSFLHSCLDADHIKGDQ